MVQRRSRYSVADMAVTSGKPSKGFSLGVLEPLEEDMLARFWLLAIFARNGKLLGNRVCGFGPQTQRGTGKMRIERLQKDSYSDPW